MKVRWVHLGSEVPSEKRITFIQSSNQSYQTKAASLLSIQKLGDLQVSRQMTADDDFRWTHSPRFH